MTEEEIKKAWRLYMKRNRLKDWVKKLNGNDVIRIGQYEKLDIDMDVHERIKEKMITEMSQIIVELEDELLNL